jgi:hypothetical protein
VVIPSYNHARFIVDAIESVINQSYRHWELILVDDGSTDSTREILDQRYRDHQKIRLVYQANHGAHHALNQGIALAKGRYISILNSDDLYHPDRLQTLLNHCDSHVCGLAFTPLTPVNAEGAADMECGNYKFKVAAGGEMSLSTSQFDQSNKNFKGYVAAALSQALSNPQTVSNDPKLAQVFQKMQQGKQSFSEVLVPDELVGQIKEDPKLFKKLQQMQIKGPDGKVSGTVFDEEGNLNPLASASSYSKAWEESAKELMKGKKNTLKTPPSYQ